eukprot:6213844-Pleurochrysis_carterae.AAC.7
MICRNIGQNVALLTRRERGRESMRRQPKRIGWQGGKGGKKEWHGVARVTLPSAAGKQCSTGPSRCSFGRHLGLCASPALSTTAVPWPLRKKPLSTTAALESVKGPQDVVENAFVQKQNTDLHGMQKNNECETRVGLSGNCAYMYVVHGKKYKQDSAITLRKRAGCEKVTEMDKKMEDCVAVSRQGGVAPVTEKRASDHTYVMSGRLRQQMGIK